MSDSILDIHLQALSENENEPLFEIWRHVRQTLDESGPERAMLQVVLVFRAQRLGELARGERHFDSCPYPEFEGEPTSTSDLLRLAWMSGYTTKDIDIRCSQAERSIYNAYKALGELREYTDHKKDIGISSKEEFARRLRHIHGTILTSSVKQRVIDEERETQQVLELFSEEERRRRL